MSVKLAVGEKLGVIPLSEHLVRGDCHRVREVQAPRLFNHRDSHTSLPVLYKQTFGQTARLLAEHKVTAVAVLGVGVAAERLRCKIEKFSALVFFKKIVNTIIVGNIEQMPVIEPRAL